MSEIDWASLHKDATTTLTGDFSVVITEATAQKTSNGDKDMIKWKAKIETGPYAGRPLWGNFTISPESPGAMRILFAHLAALGVDGAFFQKYPKATIAQIASALTGRQAIATVGVRQWNGQDREEVQGWKKPEIGGAGGVSLGVLGGFGGGPSSIPSVPAVAASTPSTPPATAASTPAAGVPAMRMNTEPAVAELTEEPPGLPF